MTRNVCLSSPTIVDPVTSNLPQDPETNKIENQDKPNLQDELVSPPGEQDNRNLSSEKEVEANGKKIESTDNSGNLSTEAKANLIDSQTEKDSHESLVIVKQEIEIPIETSDSLENFNEKEGETAINHEDPLDKELEPASNLETPGDIEGEPTVKLENHTDEYVELD